MIGIDSAMRMHPRVVAAAAGHAQLESPRECCGLLLGRRRVILDVVALRNIAAATNRFELDPLEAAQRELDARRRGLQLRGYYHSHAGAAAHPIERTFPAASGFDRRGALWCDLTGLLHLIVTTAGDWALFRVHPEGWVVLSSGSTEVRRSTGGFPGNAAGDSAAPGAEDSAPLCELRALCVSTVHTSGGS